MAYKNEGTKERGGKTVSTTAMRSDGSATTRPSKRERNKVLAVKVSRNSSMTRAEYKKSVEAEHRLAAKAVRASHGEGLVEITDLDADQTYALLFGGK